MKTYKTPATPHMPRTNTPARMPLKPEQAEELMCSIANLVTDLPDTHHSDCFNRGKAVDAIYNEALKKLQEKDPTFYSSASLCAYQRLHRMCCHLARMRMLKWQTEVELEKIVKGKEMSMLKEKAMLRMMREHDFIWGTDIDTPELWKDYHEICCALASDQVNSREDKAENL